MKYCVLFFMCFPLCFAQLSSVRFFAYQIQGLTEPGAIDSLCNSVYDMVVLEPTRTERGATDFNTAGMVAQVKASQGTALPNKIVLAYIDIGEAEEWRTYWQSWWVPPTETSRGMPDFLIAPDPDGWSGCYPVAYWDPRWQEIVVDGDSSLLKMAIADGFDGVYMDWVEAYYFLSAVADSEGVRSDSAMISFISHIRNVARSINPNFLVVPQNAAWLPVEREEDSIYYQYIDAIGQECLSFRGEADVPWGDPNAGDIPTPSSERTELTNVLQEYRARGKPVFIIDYAQIPANINSAYDYAYSQGFIPFVTQTPLDRLPNYFPPGYRVNERSSFRPAILKAYPNPFNTATIIMVESDCRAAMQICDISGKVIEQFRILPGINRIVWKPDNLPSGVYLVSVKQNVVGKIIFLQ